MMVLALLWFASLSRVTLIDEVVRVPRSGWHVVDVNLLQRPAIVEASHTVIEKGSSVRAVLLSREDAQRFASGERHQALGATAFQQSGQFRAAVTTPGEYRILLDSRLEGRRAVHVHLRVSILFGGETARRHPGTLPPGRRAVVVVASLLFFAAVVTWSGRRLLSALARRSAGPPPPLW